MKQWGLRLLWALLALVLAAAVGLAVLQRWIGSDDFRARVQAQAETALGVPVTLGRLQVDPWPVPAVALDQVVLRTRAALTAERIELRLRLQALLAGRLEVASLVLRRADLPQQGIDELLAAVTGPSEVADRGGNTQPGNDAPSRGGAQPLVLIPRRLVLEHVTWRNTRGEATTISLDADLDLLGLPDELKLAVSAGALQGAQLKAKRQRGSAEGAGATTAPRWDIRVAHAGGTIEGRLLVQLPTAGGTRLSVQGQFETRNVQLSAVRRGAQWPLGGRLRASTTVSATAATTAGLALALQTQSSFTVDDAVLKGIDLVKAVQTVGLSRGGQTRLDSLSGQVTTRGRAIALSQLAARSGVLSATGNVAVAPNRSLSGRIHVNLAEKVVGKAVRVPLVVGGTLDAPTVTLTRGAMLGAAIGTLVMPGVGTGAGATLGDAVGDKLKGLFGK